MRNMEKIGIFFSVFLIIITIFLSSQTGFPSRPQDNVVYPTQTTVAIKEATIIPVTTIKEITNTPTNIVPVALKTTTTSQQNYKIADVVLEFNTIPRYGFRMEYPSEWIYTKEQDSGTSNPIDLKNIMQTAGHNFSSPDGESKVFVFFVGNWYWNSSPVEIWANETISSMTATYCLDGSGNPLRFDYCSNQRNYYHLVKKSDETVFITGSSKSRKLVFISNDDKNYGQNIVYLMQVGVPGEFHGFALEFYSPSDQMNTTSSIYNHMIDSFQITST